MRAKVLIIGLLLFVGFSLSKEVGFTQEDRERLIRLEATLKVFMEQTDKRFEQVDKRITELREDMSKRFEQTNTFLWIITGIFTTLTVSVIGFAWWDRRTIIREAKRQTIEELERETKPEKLRRLLNVLRERAKTDEELRELLKREGLL